MADQLASPNVDFLRPNRRLQHSNRLQPGTWRWQDQDVVAISCVDCGKPTIWVVVANETTVRCASCHGVTPVVLEGFDAEPN